MIKTQKRTQEIFRNILFNQSLKIIYKLKV
jgi:hypothetical protein